MKYIIGIGMFGCNFIKHITANSFNNEYKLILITKDLSVAFRDADYHIVLNRDSLDSLNKILQESDKVNVVSSVASNTLNNNMIKINNNLFSKYNVGFFAITPFKWE